MPTFIGNGYGEWAAGFNTSADPETMYVTCGFENEDNSSDIGALLTQLRTALVGTGKIIDTATMFNTWQLTELKVQTRVDGILYDGVDNTPAVGAATGVSILNNTALLVQKRSPMSGRRNRGRWYWPPYDLVQTNVSNTGIINAAYVASKQTKFTALIPALTAVNFKPVILHSVSEIAPSPIVTMPVQFKAATQRRRLRP